MIYTYMLHIYIYTFIYIYIYIYTHITSFSDIHYFLDSLASSESRCYSGKYVHAVNSAHDPRVQKCRVVVLVVVAFQAGISQESREPETVSTSQSANASHFSAVIRSFLLPCLS